MQPLLRPIFVAFAHFSYHHRDYVTAPLAMYIPLANGKELDGWGRWLGHLWLGDGGGGGQGHQGERTCGGKLFPHFVLSNSNTRDLH